MERQRDRKSGLAVLVIVVLALAPILYVLSTGPVVAVCGTNLPTGIEAVYSPIEAIIGLSPRLEFALLWYLSWWNEEFASALAQHENRLLQP